MLLKPIIRLNLVVISCMFMVLCKIVQVRCDEPTAARSLACMHEKHTGMHQGKRNFCRSGIRGSSAFLNSFNFAVYKYCHLLYCFGSTSAKYCQIHLFIHDLTIGLFQGFSVVFV